MAESAGDFSNLFKKADKSKSSAAEQLQDNDECEPSKTALAPPDPELDARETHYDMSGDKIMVIFNHYEYQKTQYFRYKRPTARKGTARDVLALSSTFRRFGFTVTTHHEKTHDDILRILKELCDQPHRKTSCVCVCVLTHGEKGELFAADRPYEPADLVNILQHSAPGLVGKPKLLIVQACRGGLLDPGKVQLDGPVGMRLPSHADTLILTSSVEDYVSWRDLNGSWLIQELCRVLSAKHQALDLLQVTTLVTALVAERESNTPRSPNTHRMRQTPETRSTLTRLLRFTRAPSPPSAPAAPTAAAAGE